MAGHIVGAVRGVTVAVVRYLVTDVTLVRTVTEPLRQVLLSGASITVPVVVTLLVVGVVLDFLRNLLTPFAHALALLGLTGGQNDVVALALVVLILFGIVFLAGVLAKSRPATNLGRGVGQVVQAVPGVGPVYSSFARMSDVMFDGDAPSFREVKLVEFPHADVYSLAFQTSAVRVTSGTEGDGEEMMVLFVPLAPNPVMGGFMVCVPVHRVRDVDMTVQEAFQAIVTSGVAMAPSLRS